MQKYLKTLCIRGEIIVSSFTYNSINVGINSYLCSTYFMRKCTIVYKNQLVGQWKKRIIQNQFTSRYITIKNQFIQKAHNYMCSDFMTVEFVLVQKNVS
jgi:hypothetical protein